MNVGSMAWIVAVFVILAVLGQLAGGKGSRRGGRRRKERPASKPKAESVSELIQNTAKTKAEEPEAVKPSAPLPPPKARTSVMSEREQSMYNRILETLPGYPVLAEVSFSALLTSDNQGTRNSFSRKRADFVILSRALEVLVVIELDDRSHWGREQEDADRQKLLTDAGYRVMRFANVPDVDVLRTAFVAAVANRGVNAAPHPSVSSQE